MKFSPLTYVSASLLLSLAACGPSVTTVTGDASPDAAAADVPAAPDGGTDAPVTPDATVTPDGGTPGAATAVLTFLGDPGRTGANRAETRLTPAAVRAGFGRDRAFAPTIQGDIYGQPLYVPGMTVAGVTRDLLFVATEANNVYGLDAATGAEVWRTNLGPTVSRTQQGCGNISTIGVTSSWVRKLFT